MSIHWVNDTVLELIESYKQHRSLWDPTHGQYRSKTDRKEAFNKISKKIGFSVDEIEKKIHGLRTQFQREHKKPNKSPWFAYDALLFLLEIDTAKRASVGGGGGATTSPAVKGNYKIERVDMILPHFEEELDDDDNDDDTYTDEKGILPIKRSRLDSSNDIKDDTILTNKPKTRQSRHTLKTTKRRSLTPPQTPISTLASPTSTNTSTGGQGGQTPTTTVIIDHLDTFGKYVREELKSIEHDPYAIQVAKHRINQILFEATTGVFKRN